jgi:hypothetical protein
MNEDYKAALIGLTYLRPEPNPFLEGAAEKACKYLDALLTEVPEAKFGAMPHEMDERTVLLLAAWSDTAQFLDAVRAELASARRKARALQPTKAA